MRSTYVFSDIPNRSKHPQHIQKPIVIVLPLKWSAAVAFGERFEDFGGDEVGAEEGAFGGHFDWQEERQRRRGEVEEAGATCVVLQLRMLF
jgi:hypothetical protein